LFALLATAGAVGLGAVAPVGDQASRALPPLVVDPNSAPPPVLSALPRLGPSLVGRIEAARSNAPFRSLDDFDHRVRGIGPATIDALRSHLRFDTDHDPISVDARTLVSARLAQNAP